MYSYKKLNIKGVYIDEHRYIMQNHLGRKLLRHEHVHHKNRNKRDNRLENLELISASEHMRLHILNGDIRPSIPTIENKLALRKRFSKLTEGQVLIVRNSNESGKTLANRFNVSKFVISRIRRNKSWFDLNLKKSA